MSSVELYCLALYSAMSGVELYCLSLYSAMSGVELYCLSLYFVMSGILLCVSVFQSTNHVKSYNIKVVSGTILIISYLAFVALKV